MLRLPMIIPKAYHTEIVKEVLAMSKQQVFFSFEYNKDAWRAAQIRNICLGSYNVVTTDRDWEEVRVKSTPLLRNGLIRGLHSVTVLWC